MQRSLLAIVAAVAVLVSGCGNASPIPAPPSVPAAESQAPASVPTPAASAEPSLAPPDPGVDLRHLVETPHVAPADLVAPLRDFANAADGPVLPRLIQALNTKPEPGAVIAAEADLDGDGVPETVTAPKPSHPGNGAGSVYVIYRKDGKYEVDRTADAPDTSLPLTGVMLHGLRDIDGDRRPEIVWSTTMLVAHGPPATVFVSRWVPGQFVDLPGSVGMMSMSLELDGRDIVLSGGGAGGNSGPGQAFRTDRYGWVDGRVRLVERTIANPGSDGYTWLMQAISDEDLGKPERAADGYRRVLEPGRPVLSGFFSSDPVATEENFASAVRDMAQFRLGLLLLGKEPAPAARGLPGALVTAKTRSQACQTASAWMTAHPEYEQALNSLFGYAHPNWTAANVCGALYQATTLITSP